MLLFLTTKYSQVTRRTPCQNDTLAPIGTFQKLARSINSHLETKEKISFLSTSKTYLYVLTFMFFVAIYDDKTASVKIEIKTWNGLLYTTGWWMMITCRMSIPISWFAMVAKINRISFNNKWLCNEFVCATIITMWPEPIRLKSVFSCHGNHFPEMKKDHRPHMGLLKMMHRAGMRDSWWHSNQYTIWRRGMPASYKFRLVSFMMTSSNGNIFRDTGYLCWEFPGPRGLPRTKVSDAELWCFLWSAPE